MCGRFSQFFAWSEMHAFGRPLIVETPSNLPPQYNIAPTDQAGVIWKDEESRWHYETMRWGLIPRWWSRPLKGMAPMHNARAEEADTKPAFRDAFRRTRCLVPASGFFEWTGDRKTRKPHFISSTDGRPLMFAGLYDRWKNRETGEVISSFTIIVTDANPFMGEIHDRMPVILAEENWDAWLDAPQGSARPGQRRRPPALARHREDERQHVQGSGFGCAGVRRDNGGRRQLAFPERRRVAVGYRNRADIPNAVSTDSRDVRDWLGDLDSNQD